MRWFRCAPDRDGGRRERQIRSLGNGPRQRRISSLQVSQEKENV